jgi:hypothetical protein
MIALASFVAGAIITYMITSSGDTIKIDCPTFDYTTATAFPGISTATAQLLAEGYREEIEPVIRAARIQSGGDQDLDALSINFSLPVLKKYIWEIESKVCPQKTLDVSKLGIRCYYGKYPDLNTSAPNDLSSIDPLYSYRHTLFMVPTYTDGTLIFDVDPEKPETFNKDADSSSLSTNKYIMNHGNLAPPPFGASETNVSLSALTGMRY